MIQNQIEKVKYDQTFQPIQLPIKSSVEREIINLYPNYEYKTQINNDDMIVHCHRLRDRSDIIAARKALKIKERKVKSFTFLSFFLSSGMELIIHLSYLRFRHMCIKLRR